MKYRLWLLLLALWLLPATAVVAQTGEEAVESGREALQGMWGANWYDSAQDDLRRVAVRTPPPPPQPSSGNWDWLGSLFYSFGTLIKWTAISLLVLVLAGIIYWMVRAYYWRDRRRISMTDDVTDFDPQAEIDRVEALPVDIRRPRGNLLDEARYFYEQAQYSEAIVYLYSYYLVQLDLKHYIRLARGKTNRQYLRELGGQTELRHLLENSMILFEDAFFGKRALSRAQFEFAWNRLDDFHRWTKLPAAAGQ
ncbi:MAG: hypothetical protein WD030_03215 [Pirellulales bacterium]